MRKGQDPRESLRAMHRFLQANADKAAPGVPDRRRPPLPASTAKTQAPLPRETHVPRQAQPNAQEGAAAIAPDIADYRALGELYASDNATLREQLDGLQRRLHAEQSRAAMLDDERRRLLFHLRQKQDRAPDADAASPASSSAPRSVAEAVDAAARLFGDRLHFLPRAWTSAELSPFERPGEVLDAFRALADVAALRASSGSLRAPMRETLSAVGLDYRPGITRGTPKRLRLQYEIPDEDGNIHFCEEHLVFGTSLNPEHCLRVYLVSPTDDEPRFIIGHVGRHAETMT